MATGPQAQRAADAHADDLSAYPNVVGIGVRPVGDEQSATAADAYAVVVYVSEKIPVAQLDDYQQLPDHVEVFDRGQVEQVPVVVVAVGVVEPENSTEPAQERGFTIE